MKTPFFSIVLTTYNRAKLLPRALESLINQTEKDWELILIDDGSTDQTAEIIKPYLKAIENINYFYQENQGFINAKNVGIRKSTGRYITFLDSDDEYHPTHLAKRKQLLKKEENIDFLHGGVKIIGSAYVPDANNPTEKIHLSDCFIGGTFILNKKAVQKLKGFESTALKTDYDFMQRAKSADLKIVKTDFPTYIYYRDSENSITLDMLAELDKKSTAQ